MRKILTLIVVATVVFSCTDDKNPPISRNIFTFTLDDAPETQETWIILRDNQTGDLIDSRQIVNNTTEVFESDKNITDNILSVTLFRSSIGKTGRRENTTTVYGAIEVGSAWSFPRISTLPDKGEELGSYSLTISGVEEAFAVNVSDEFGLVNSGDFGHGLGYIYDFVSVNKNSKGKQLLTIDFGQEENPRYAWISPGAIGENVERFYSELKEFDKVVTLTFPNSYEIVTKVVGYEGTPSASDSYNLYSYQFYAHDNPITRNQLTLGFLNSIPYYSVSIDRYPFFYRSRGPAPASIEYISSSGYSLSETSKDYLYQVSEYTDFGGNDIVYYGPKGYKRVNELFTPEIVSKYSFDITKIPYYGSNLIVRGRSYAEFVRANFDPTYDPNTPYYETLLYVH